METYKMLPGQTLHIGEEREGREVRTIYTIKRPDGSIEREIVHVATTPTWMDD